MSSFSNIAMKSASRIVLLALALAGTRAMAQQPVPARAGATVTLSLDDALRLVQTASQTIEVARADLLRARGWTYREMEESGVLLPVIEAACEYRRPARYDDEVAIRTTAEIVSPVRMTFNYEITVKGEAGVAAIGHTTHAATDLKGKPCRIPARVLEVFA